MNFKLQFKILLFLQFCFWGSWFIMFGLYMFVMLKFDGVVIGVVYSLFGIVVVLMLMLFGIVVDKWISVKWVYVICYLVGVLMLYFVVQVIMLGEMFFVILFNLLVYMLMFGLINIIFYYCLQLVGLDIVIDFLLICIWGIIGFIFVMWGVSFFGFELSYMQLYIGVMLLVLLILFILMLLYILVVNVQCN